MHIARRNSYSYTYLVDGTTSTGAHRLTLHVTDVTGGVHLVLDVDGAQKLDFTDTSSGALTGSGLPGIFCCSGAGTAFDNFSVAQP